MSACEGRLGAIRRGRSNVYMVELLNSMLFVDVRLRDVRREKLS